MLLANTATSEKVSVPTVSPPTFPLPGDRSLSAPLTTDASRVLFAHPLEEGLPVEEVHRRAVDARKHLAHAQRALSFYLVDMEKRMLYRHFGCSSVFQYGELYLELAPHTTAEYLRSGKEMARLPLLAAACEKGEISPSKIREISRVAVPGTEEAWLSLARNSTYRQIEKLVPLTPRGGLPPAAATNTHTVAGCSHRAAAGAHGGLEGRARGWGKDTCGQEAFACRREENTQGREEDARSLAAYPEPGGDSIRTDETEIAHGLALSGREDEEAGEGVGPRQYRTKFVLELEHDRMAIITRALEKARKESGEWERGALLAYIARAFLDKSPAERGGTVKGGSVPCRVTIHHLSESGISWIEPGGAPGSPSSSGLQYVPASTLEEALCDAEVLDLGEPEAPLNSGSLTGSPVGNPGRDLERHGPRMRRTIPLTLRRKVLERDEHRCTAPGCGRGNFLSLHHIVPVSAGGGDNAGNITTTCSRCHRALHTLMLFVEGEAPGALVWKNRHGAVIKGGALPPHSAEKHRAGKRGQLPGKT